MTEVQVAEAMGARFSMPSVDKLAEIKADAEKIKIAHPEHFADKFSTICYGFAD